MPERAASFSEPQSAELQEKKPIEFRTLQESEYGAAATLIKKTILHSYASLYPPELIQKFCDKYSAESMAERAVETTYFTAHYPESDELIGIIGLKGNQLRTFYVDPNHQGKGIGRKLYQLLEEEARARGVAELTLEGSPLGQPAYEAFGFKVVGTHEKERDGYSYTDALMTKSLTPGEDNN